MTEILKQNDREPLPIEEEVVVLYAALGGYFDGMPLQQIKETEGKFIQYLRALHKETILEPIQKTGEFTPDMEAMLKGAIEEFKRSENL